MIYVRRVMTIKCLGTGYSINRYNREFIFYVYFIFE